MDSRAETLASRGESAFDAGFIRLAKLCAESGVGPSMAHHRDYS